MHTWSLHQVFLLAVAVAANVIEGEEKVMLLMQLSRQLYFYLEVRKTQNLNPDGALFRKIKENRVCRAFPQ